MMPTPSLLAEPSRPRAIIFADRPAPGPFDVKICDMENL